MSISLKKTLEKLNKNKEENEAIKTAYELGEEHFIRKVFSTGSPWIDYHIHNVVGKGGFLRGSLNLLVGGEGSAKTSFSLLAAAEMQRTTGRYCVFIDGEKSLNDSYIKRMGIDTSKFIVISTRNLEEMLDTVVEFSKTPDVGMIIIDSIPIFIATSVEEKSAHDNHMAVEARKFTARMPIIENNCAINDIALVALTFYTSDPGAMGDPRVLKRGEWQRKMSNLTIEITKKEIIKDKDKNPIGHRLDIRIKKSKLKGYDPKDVFSANFYYDKGFDKTDEYLELFIVKGIVEQGGGGNYSFPDQDDVEVKIRGKEALLQYFKENEDNFNYLLSLYEKG